MAHGVAARRRWLTAAAWMSLIVFATTTTLLSVSLKHIGVGLGIDFGARGSIALVRAVALTVSALAAGVIADRWGKRWLMTGAMLFVAAGLLWAGAAGSYAHLLTAVVIMGVGLGCLEALVSPLVAQLHPADVPTQMSLLHAFYPVGIVVSSLFIGSALDQGVRWQAAFAVVALPAAAVAFMFMRGGYPRASRAAGVDTLRAAAILRQPAFWLLAAAMVFGAGCEGGLAYWTPNFVQNEFGTGAATGGLGLMCFSAAMAAGRFGMGAATRRVSVGWLFGAMIGLGIASVACLSVARSLPLAMAMLVLGGVSVAIVWPGILTLAAERISASSATLFAMLSAAGILGFGVIPQLLGVVAEAWGLRRALWVVSASFVGMGLALAGLWRSGRAQGGTG